MAPHNRQTLALDEMEQERNSTPGKPAQEKKERQNAINRNLGGFERDAQSVADPPRAHQL
jgi:hypothetical protein